MINRILVPLDGSDLAEGVLPHVKDLAKQLHGKVHLIRVLDFVSQEVMAFSMGATATTEVVEEIERKDREEAEGYLSQVAGRLAAEGLEVSWEVVEGTAAGEIVDLAHTGSADLIAMSTHGRSGLSRVIFGSVAAKVVREVGIPVMLIKPAWKMDEE